MAMASFEDLYFSGKRLYGDDFTGEDLLAWFEAEREASAELSGGPSSVDTYGCHVLNEQLGFRWLRQQRPHFGRALGLGSGFAGEWIPIADLIEALTILEPSHQHRSEKVGAITPTYVDPDMSGAMPFDDASFDFVMTIGVLHHIANVSTVLGEIGRVLRPGGLVLIRDTIVTMGDWRQPRRNLTRSERGIPLGLLQRMITDAGLRPIREQFLGSPLTSRIGTLFRVQEVYNSTALVWLDRMLANAFRWNYRYHATKPWQRFRPLSLNVLAERPHQG